MSGLQALDGGAGEEESGEEKGGEKPHTFILRGCRSPSRSGGDHFFGKR
jgi:hypothetical protein